MEECVNKKKIHETMKDVNMSVPKNRFIEKAKLIHSDENLDYSKVKYVNNRTKVTIIDHDLDENGNEYGEYEVTPSNHLHGQSHPRKRGKKIRKSKQSVFTDLVKRFNVVHKSEKLDYSKSVYINMHTPICIIDHDLDDNGNEYGEFWQEPNAHLKGCSNRMKGIKKCSLKNRMTTEEFINKAKLIHGDKYDYSKTEYVAYRKNVIITCKKHGDFEQTPESHLEGKGCQKCGKHYSKYDDEIADFIVESGLIVVRHDREILDGKEIDILMPSKHLGIEFNGLRWHTEWFAGKDKNYHLDKTKLANSKGYGLIQIFEDEYVKNKELVQKKLLHIFGLSNTLPKIMARKSVVRNIQKADAEIFLNKYHIQGFVSATLYYGCFYNEELIAVMTFKTKNNGVWELTRFASNDNYILQGVGGKIFKYFVKYNNPNMVISFADKRWTINIKNNLYVKLGFYKETELKPDYTYFNPSVDRFTRFHKFRFRKACLNRKYGMPTDMTEIEMVKKLGYDRIWNCGLIKYVWING